MRLSPLTAAVASLSLLADVGPALAGARLEPVAGAGVTLEQRSGHPVAFSRQPGSAVALMVEQASYGSHDRPTLVLSIANGGKAPITFTPDALQVTAGGVALRMWSVAEIQAEAERDARTRAEMRASAAYASAEGRYSSTNVVEGGASVSRSMVSMADVTRSSGVLSGFRASAETSSVGLKPVTIAPGEVATLYVPIRKLTRTDADLQVRVTVGGETHLLPLHVDW
jgi:archaellum component FlaG (FlaF/FlaG flagellin family)